MVLILMKKQDTGQFEQPTWVEKFKLLHLTELSQKAHFLAPPVNS